MQWNSGHLYLWAELVERSDLGTVLDMCEKTFKCVLT